MLSNNAKKYSPYFQKECIGHSNYDISQHLLITFLLQMLIFRIVDRKIGSVITNEL